MKAIHILLLALALVAFGCGTEEPKAANAATTTQEPPPLPADVAKVAPATTTAPVTGTAAENTLSATGEFVAPVRSELSPKIPGRVARLHVDEGSLVRRGQPVLELESDYAVLNLRAPSVLLGFQVGGIVGHKFLAQYHVSMDLAQSELRLQKSEEDLQRANEARAEVGAPPLVARADAVLATVPHGDADTRAHLSTIDALVAATGLAVPAIQATGLNIGLATSTNFFTARGGRANEGVIQIDGLTVGSPFNGGGVSSYILDSVNSEEVSVTVSGARQHLSSLERDGVVTYQRVRQGPGRPRHLYELTERGDLGDRDDLLCLPCLEVDAGDPRLLRGQVVGPLHLHHHGEVRGQHRHGAVLQVAAHVEQHAGHGG